MDNKREGQDPAGESKFTDLELLIREQACNGTQDCENGPECPEGSDGCFAINLADDVCQHLDDVLATEFEGLKGTAPMLVATLSSKNLTITEYMSAAVDTYRINVLKKLREETER